MSDAGFHQLFMMGRHPMPGAWQSMLPEDAAWLKLPAERWATCASCHKVALGEFRSDCQCCTYFPQIPNFMLGLALADDVAGPAVREVIAAGHATPQGLLASPVAFRGAVEMEARESFGNDSARQCFFFEPDTRNCRVYAYRNSVCSTFFCDNDHGDDGAAAWARLQGLMGRIEIGLSHWAMGEVGLAAADYLARLDALAEDVAKASSAEGSWSTTALDALWGEWRGREEAFFVACAEAVTRRRDDLFVIAKDQPYREALRFERAVRDWIPEDIRDEVPEISDDDVEPPSIHDLYYKLDLALRHLWALPFQDGTVQLAPGIAIAADPESGKLALASRVGHYALTVPRDDDEPLTVWITPPERRLLAIFARGRAFDESLFERPELDALEDARGFLASCLRQGILVHRPAGAPR